MSVVLTGDCRSVLANYPPETFDCVFTDPPYGETSLEWDRWQTGWVAAAKRVLKRTGSMWCFGSQRMFLEHYGEFVAAGFRLSHDVVWEKHNGTGLFNDRFRRVHELALHFYRDDCAWKDVFKAPQFTNDAKARTVRKKARPAHWIGATGDTVYRSEDGGPRLMRSVIFCRSEHGRAVHPTQKPIDLIRPLLAYACPKGGKVIDPFGGSGSTAIAANEIGAIATIIEARENFANIARDRIDNTLPLLVGA